MPPIRKAYQYFFRDRSNLKVEYMISPIRSDIRRLINSLESMVVSKAIINVIDKIEITTPNFNLNCGSGTSFLWRSNISETQVIAYTTNLVTVAIVRAERKED